MDIGANLFSHIMKFSECNKGLGCGMLKKTTLHSSSILFLSFSFQHLQLQKQKNTHFLLRFPLPPLPPPPPPTPQSRRWRQHHTRTCLPVVMFSHVFTCSRDSTGSHVWDLVAARAKRTQRSFITLTIHESSISSSLSWSPPLCTMVYTLTIVINHIQIYNRSSTGGHMWIQDVFSAGSSWLKDHPSIKSRVEDGWHRWSKCLQWVPHAGPAFWGDMSSYPVFFAKNEKDATWTHFWIYHLYHLLLSQ